MVTISEAERFHLNIYVENGSDEGTFMAMDIMPSFPLAAACSLSDLIHGEDDTIDARIRLTTAQGSDGRSTTLIDATVTSAFWDDASVADYDRLLIQARFADVDLLVVALFEMLGVQVRKYGVPDVGFCYPDFRDFLADHLPPAVAARLDDALCLAIPPAADGGTISFSV